jgi:hypothetical protein
MMNTRPSPLFRLLQWLFPPERPNEEELIAYGRQQEREQQVARATIYTPVCPVHTMLPLQHIGYSFYRCTLCQQSAMPLVHAREPHTDRIEQVPQLPLPVAPQRPPNVPLQPGQWARTVRKAPGNSVRSQVLNAVKQQEKQV